jgi:phosphatidylserine/phosphatidylglycerophosphate/cardiolipin synthase-like enzyme
MIDVARLVAQWPDLVVALHFAVAVGASAHVLLHEKESRAAVGWLGLVWLSPLVGSIAHLVLGINRIHRPARQLRPPPATEVGRLPGPRSAGAPTGPRPDQGALADLARVIDASTTRPLLPGNGIVPLWDGDEAYPGRRSSGAAACPWTGGPFAHTRLVIVDQAWTLFGSANWDPRSLQLNFELNVEACGEGLARERAARMEARMADASEVGPSIYSGQGPLLRLRDGLAPLGAPYP